MNINIDDYTDFENVTIAEFKTVLAHTERLAIDELKKGHFKESAKYGVLYIKLEKLLSKKIAYGSKDGYEKGNIK